MEADDWFTDAPNPLVPQLCVTGFDGIECTNKYEHLATVKSNIIIIKRLGYMKGRRVSPSRVVGS